MSDTTSIINLGELSKPATVLVEKIADAIGGLARPWQIKRVAEAEAEADKIHAVVQIEITQLQKRAMTRLVAEEARKQNNIESITAKALPQLDSNAKPENVEDDWIANFFDKSRLISDEEMQTLWAKILAGEANSAGSFSRRTVNVVSELDKTDALLFSEMCTFNIGFAPAVTHTLIYDKDHSIYHSRGINFGSLAHLESAGLIHFNHLSGYRRRGLGKSGHLNYFGQMVWIEFAKPAENEMELGHVLLTQAGQQLAAICALKPHPDFVEYLREKWKSLGYKTEPPPTNFGPSQF